MQMRHRRRTGLAWILVGFLTLGAVTLLAVATTNWRLLLDTSAFFMLSFALGLILLAQPPRRPRATSRSAYQEQVARDAMSIPAEAKGAPAHAADHR